MKIDNRQKVTKKFHFRLALPTYRTNAANAVNLLRSPSYGKGTRQTVNLLQVKSTDFESRGN
jgi:hypothetical protein